MRRKVAIGFSVLGLMLVAGCPGPVGPVEGAYALRGRVEFRPASARAVQATLAEVADAATVSLIDASSGVTVATTRTTSAGAFVLSFGAGFRPVTGAPYYLEAVKGLKDLGAASNQAGAGAARVRTLLVWQDGWTSITNAVPDGGLVVNRSTTALSAIASLRALQAASASALVGTLTLGATESTPLPATPDSFAVSDRHGVSSQEFHTVWGLVDDALLKDLDPLGSLSYSAGAYGNAGNQSWMVADFRQGSKSNVAVAEAGYAQLSYAVPPAPVPKSSNEEAYFAAGGVAPNAAGIVACDGTYLYAKCWNSYDNEDANAHVFKRVGTGFNGTTRGQGYGTVGGATAQALTAAYWGGSVFNAGGALANNQLERLDLSSGTLSTVTLEAPQFTRHTWSTSGGGSYILTTDGTYFYSTSYDDDASGYDYQKVRVLDPANNFALVREIFFDRATASYYTDGSWCDGIYYYPIEWTGATSARLRRYRLSDGQLEAQWTFDQSPHPGNDPIQGQYDWVNNKFWIGNLTTEHVRMIRGGTFQASGTYVSPAYDTGKASRFRALTWGGDVPAGTSVSFQIRSADTREALESVAWYGPTGTSDSYTSSGQAVNTINSRRRWVQVRATLSTTDTAMKTPRLKWYKLLYQ